MPGGIFGVGWALMALGYSYSGYTKLVSPSWMDGSAVARVLDNPLARPGMIRELLLMLPEIVLRAVTWGSLGLELAFAPLALVGRLRPWIWTGMLLMHLSLMTVIDFADLSLGLVILHLFTFNPSWIRPLPSSGKDWLFYDGTCGLCHRAVRFLLAEGPTASLRFAPLGGPGYLARVPASEQRRLPDSLVLSTGGGALLVRSAAVLLAMKRLGGAWRCLAMIGGLLPAVVLDRGYDIVASVRYRLFARPTEACPLLPEHLRARFEP